jgi:hypothetical protein
MADQFTGSNSSVEGLAHSIPAHRVFSDPASQLMDDLQEAKGDLCGHEEGQSPSPRFLERETTPYPTSALASPHFPTGGLSLADRGPTRCGMEPRYWIVPSDPTDRLTRRG